MLAGMDTPQAGPTRLAAVAEQPRTHDAVPGPAEDGGWWVLGLRHPQAARALSHVPMSNPFTRRLTRAALTRHGLTVASSAIMRTSTGPRTPPRWPHQHPTRASLPCGGRLEPLRRRRDDAP